MSPKQNLSMCVGEYFQSLWDKNMLSELTSSNEVDLKESTTIEMNVFF